MNKLNIISRRLSSLNTMYGGFKITLVTLTLLAAVSNGKIEKPLASRDERTSKLQSMLPSNEYLQGPSGTSTAKLIVKLQDKIVAKGSCNPNLCFGLDGSNLISNRNYERQREFVQLIAATLAIDKNVRMSAYQYGLRLQPISDLTDDIDSFLLKMNLAKRERTLEFSFLAPALFQCQRDFRPYPEDANKIVLIGDGRTNYGSRSLAIRVAEQFLPPYNNGAICAVYVRRPSVRFLEKITQNPDNVLFVEDYFYFDEILGEMVHDICNLV